MTWLGVWTAGGFSFLIYPLASTDGKVYDWKYPTYLFPLERARLDSGWAYRPFCNGEEPTFFLN